MPRDELGESQEEQEVETFRGEKPCPLDLAAHQLNELEVYHSVKRSAFFSHHLANSFRYFAERNNETAHLLANKLLLQPEQDRTQVQHSAKYQQMFQTFHQQKEQQQKQAKAATYGFGKGTRKRCNCLAVVKPGRAW